jgi:hypothetical protein
MTYVLCTVAVCTTIVVLVLIQALRRCVEYMIERDLDERARK